MHEAFLLATRQAAPVPLAPFSRDTEEILSLIGDGVISIDSQGRIILFNRAAETLFGYTSDELLGCPLEVLIPMRFHDQHQKDVDGFVSQDAPTRRSMAMGEGREVLGRHKTGRELAIEATLSRHIFNEQQTYTAVVRDITDRRSAEQRRLLVAGEVAHRLRNTMAVVSSIVSLTARNAASLPEFIHSLTGRLTAIARTNDVLISENETTVGLRELLLSELAAFQNDGDRIELVGPEVKFDGKLALDLALVLHELVTNAAKHGAFSVANGTVYICWRLSTDFAPMLEICWRENGGPLVVSPKKNGFGTLLIERALRRHGGRTRMTYDRTGVCCTITLPLPTLEPIVFGPTATSSALASERHRNGTPVISLDTGERLSASTSTT